MLFNLPSKTQFGHICRRSKYTLSSSYHRSQGYSVACISAENIYVQLWKICQCDYLEEIKLLDRSSKTHPWHYCSSWKRTTSFHIIADKLNKFLVSTKMFRSSSYQKYVKSTAKEISWRCTLCTFASDYKSKLNDSHCCRQG